MAPNPYVFIPLLAVSLLTFCYSCYRRLSLIGVGVAEDRGGNAAARLRNVLSLALGQRRVVAKPFGLNHVVIFWSFLVLLLANGEFLLRGLHPGIRLSLLPAPLYNGLLVAFDLVSLAVLVSVAVAAFRKVAAPPYPEARTLDAFVILGMIALLMIAYFGLHGAEIALGREDGAYLPVSRLTAGLLAGAPGAPLILLAFGFWWLHAVVLLVFLNYLPISKHMHILTAIPNCYYGSLERPNTQPTESFAPGNRYGAGDVRQLSWKDLLDCFACTECGRCQNACPAAATGKSLSPRRVVHEVKATLLQYERRSTGKETPEHALIGEGPGRTPEDAVWACTTCGACLAVCPVLIEQMPKIVKMRRHLVQMESSFPEELLNLFENLEQRSNPWGIAPSERAKWQTGLEVKPFEAGKTEYLFYVGCAGSFDSRQKQVTVALAHILDAAGVSWGVLGKEEMCCGDSLRRLGNEYVFDSLARENVRQFLDKGVRKIVTQCPHCFSTLKNDYRQFGIKLEVLHHSELIDQLVKARRLKLNPRSAGMKKVLLHDSCYLGRHNDVYQAPRNVIAAATGSAALEFDRSREESFCCGGGGGRMWMEEHQGSRINLNRVTESLGHKPDTLGVSCPYCLTMLEDGLKDLQQTGIQVRDLAEIVAEGLLP